MAVDPWGGFNEGMNNLNNTFVDVRKTDRQARLDDLNAQAARQSLAMGGIQLQDAQRKQTDATDLRAQLAGAAPTVTSTGGYTQDTTPQTSSVSQLYQNGAGMIPPVPPQNNYTTQPGGPNLAELSMSPANLNKPTTPAPAPNLLPPQGTGVDVPLQTTSTPADPFVTAAKFWMERGEPEKARAVMEAAKLHAEEQGNMAAVGSDNLTNYYTKIAKASLSQTQSTQIEKGLTTIAALAKEGPQYLKMAEPSIQMIPGFEKFSADSVTVDPSKRFVSVDVGNGQTVVTDNLNPKDWKLEKKDPITDFSSFHAGGLAKGLSEGQISEAWHKQKMDEQIAGKQAAARITIDSKGNMSQDAIGLAADQYLITGQMPALGMGGANAKMLILNKAAEKAKAQGLDASGIQTEIATTKGNAGSVAQQTKQIGAMGSFVKNIDKQVNRFETLSKEISSFDTRLLNVPLRSVRGKIAGSPNQAKLDMYLTEISSETGKLASGATGSVAELSQGAREKWEKIHDPNLSMADLLDLLKETRHAGQMRMQSVKDQLEETKTGMRDRGKPANTPITTKGGFKVTVVQ